MWKDSETEIDYLDFSYIVEIMKDTINDEKLLPSCIGLYGDWGSGKSSLMHMCKKQLEEQKDGTVCLLFNGWLYESYDDAKTAILILIKLISLFFLFNPFLQLLLKQLLVRQIQFIL